MTLIKKLIKMAAPLVSDTTPTGERKLSIGRLPMFLMCMIMCWHYASKGVGPDLDVLGFLGMAMAYNFGSKSKVANGNGGESTNVEPAGTGQGPPENLPS